MQTPTQKTTRPWTFAGIMLSYWCNAGCACCYVSCGPAASDWVEPAEAVRWWRELVELARSQGKAMRIHLSGGEPFGNWPVLLEIAQRAHAEGLTADGAFQKVETNAFWATDADIVRDRLVTLRELGMCKLAVSADPHHQTFVDPECVRVCVETAREVLGPDGVQVRWLDWYERMRDLRRLLPRQRQEAFREAYTLHRERLTGRAATALAVLLDAHPVSDLRAEDCRQPILAGKHVHIDPYGNVFPGVCAGIILGNASRRSMAKIYEQTVGSYADNPVLCALIEGGPHALMDCAKEIGFVPRAAGYAGKCHLCSDVRRFLFAKGVFDGKLGPGWVYGTDGADSADTRRPLW